MCSEPITHTDHKTGEVREFACRHCDECIATRRHGWVARAMAEKACHPYTVVICLSYDETTQENRDAARMFCYADVVAFMKRLNSACRYEAEKLQHNKKPVLRFICAGEQGSRNGRCHWHLIVYSSMDITKLGTFKVRGRVITDRREMITVGKQKRRLDWGMWGKGFVLLQEPDQGGMNYVLSYCLKDQFTHEKSEGTLREAKSENFATGLFRMSKRPAIGEEFLVRKMEKLAETNSVLPSIQIKIPGFLGFWYVSGTLRQKLLHGLVALNERAVMATGANAPQWSSLLGSLAENEKDMEILLGHETEKDRIEREAAASLVRRLETSRDAPAHAIDRRCGRKIPCETCLAKVPPVALRGLGLERVETGGFFETRSLKGFSPIEDRAKEQGPRLNPWCLGFEAASQDRADQHIKRPLDQGAQPRWWLEKYASEYGSSQMPTDES